MTMSASRSSATYPPLGTLKPVATDLWVVDGPVIEFGPRLLKMPFPTRTTILRLGGDLFIHSPTQLTPALAADIARLGRVRWLIGPNRLHYWWLPDWHRTFPDASVYLAPRIRQQAGARIDFDSLPLDDREGYPWDADIATLPIAGSYMTEIVFFHRATRTLVVTDLIENFEPQKLDSWLMRALVWIGGVRDPHGSMPRDMRVTFSGREHRAALKAAVDTMIAWNPERIVLAHGRWYDRDGTAELRRAFTWLLD